MTTHAQRQESAAKAVLTISGDYLDPARGVFFLWGNSVGVDGLVIDPGCPIPKGFKLIETKIQHHTRMYRVVVPDPTTPHGFIAARRFGLTKQAVRLI